MVSVKKAKKSMSKYHGINVSCCFLILELAGLKWGRLGGITVAVDVPPHCTYRFVCLTHCNQMYGAPDCMMTHEPFFTPSITEAVYCDTGRYARAM